MLKYYQLWSVLSVSFSNRRRENKKKIEYRKTFLCKHKSLQYITIAVNWQKDLTAARKKNSLKKIPLKIIENIDDIVLENR